MDRLSRADLHFHSVYSDGADSLNDIIEKARDRKVTHLALTDHNTFAGVAPFLALCEEAGLQGLAGTEITTQTDGQEVHLLAYFPSFPPDEKTGRELYQILEDYPFLKRKQNDTILMNLKEAGLDVDLDAFYEFASPLSPEGNFNRVHIAKYLVAKGLASSIPDAFNRFIGEECPAYVEKPVVTTWEAVKAVKKAGGIPVIAHYGQYLFSPEEEKEFFEQARKLGVGFELFHPSNDRACVEKLIRQAPPLFTMGSDDHGMSHGQTIGDVAGFSLNPEEEALIEKTETELIQRWPNLIPDESQA